MKTNKKIFTYVILALLPIMVLPAYVFLLLPAKFNALIIDITKNESIRVAHHLATTFIEAGMEISDPSIGTRLGSSDEDLREALQLTKLKLFAPSGRVLYSSSPEEIGTINGRKYFFEIVAQGEAYAKLVHKDSRSLEGQEVRVDVVETYVPIMRDGLFTGAFEIYYDITNTRTRLKSLVIQIHVILLLLSAILLAAILFSAAKAKRSIDDNTKLQQELHDMSITDELTGLLNRRGFMKLAEQHVAMAQRNDQILFMIYLDIDDMKWINDNLGHETGDHALREAADLLRMTFRRSDILCRMGGDEFAVLLVCDPNESCVRSIEERFYGNLEMTNAKPDRGFTLKVSMGVSRFCGQDQCHISDMMTIADAMMYEHKLKRKQSSLAMPMGHASHPI